MDGKAGFDGMNLPGGSNANPGFKRNGILDLYH
jgi:hypothetical protein